MSATASGPSRWHRNTGRHSDSESESESRCHWRWQWHSYLAMLLVMTVWSSSCDSSKVLHQELHLKVDDFSAPNLHCHSRSVPVGPNYTGSSVASRHASVSSASDAAMRLKLLELAPRPSDSSWHDSNPATSYGLAVAKCRLRQHKLYRTTDECSGIPPPPPRGG